MLNDLQSLGAALRFLRSRRGLRQYQVADRAGITKAMLSSYEIGGVKPSLHSLTVLLNALETDLAGFQQAIDVMTGRLTQEDLRQAEAAKEEQPVHTGTEVLQILVPKLAEILPVLERIALTLEGASRPALEEAASHASLK